MALTLGGAGKIAARILAWRYLCAEEDRWNDEEVEGVFRRACLAERQIVALRPALKRIGDRLAIDGKIAGVSLDKTENELAVRVCYHLFASEEASGFDRWAIKALAFKSPAGPEKTLAKLNEFGSFLRYSEQVILPREAPALSLVIKMINELRGDIFYRLVYDQKVEGFNERAGKRCIEAINRKERSREIGHFAWELIRALFKELSRTNSAKDAVILIVRELQSLGYGQAALKIFLLGIME